MKRITILLIFLGLLSISVDAQILNTFDDVMQRAKTALGQDTASVIYIDTIASRMYTRQAMSLVNRMIGDNRTNTRIVTARETYKYVLPALYTTVTSVQWISADTVKSLTQIPRGQWHQQEHKRTKAQQSFLAHPSYYDFYDDTIYFGPIPTLIDSIYVTTVDRVDAGLDTVTVLTTIDEDYRIIVLNYVIYRAAAANQHPLTANYRQDYIDVVNILFPKAVPVE